MDLKKMQIAVLNVPELSGILKGYNLDSPELVDWLSKATAGIVDYDGYLTSSEGYKESASQRDLRMRQENAYNGDIEGLTQCLKDFDKGLSTLTKWEIIVKIYNMINPLASILSGIQPVEEPSPIATEAEGSMASPESSMVEVAPEQATATEVSSGNHKDESSEVNDKRRKKPKVEEKIVPAKPDFMNLPTEPIREPVKETPTVVEKTETHENERKEAQKTQKTKVESSSVSPKQENVVQESKPPKESTTPHKVEQVNVAPVVTVPDLGQKENIINGGKSKMAERTTALNSLAAGRQQMVRRGSGSVASKPEAASAYSKQAQQQIQNSLPERTAWTNANTVMKAVTNAEPQSLRIPEGATGVLSLDGNGAGVVSKLMGAYSKATGTEAGDLENAVLDKVHPDDQLKAKEVLGLLKEMNNAPNAEYPIFVSKPSYAIKGVVFADGVPITNEQLTDLLMAKSLGWVVTSGCVQNGVAVRNADGGATFELDTTQTKVKAKNVVPNAGDTAKTGVSYKRIIRIANRAEFLADENNILIVYPTNRDVDESGMKNVRVKAAIVKTDGSVMAASFRYQVGTKEVMVKKDGQETKVTKAKYKTFSVTLSTKAFITSTQPAPEFSSMTADQLTKFGNAVSQKSSSGKTKEMIAADNTEAIEKYMQTSGMVKALSLAASGALKTADEEVTNLVQTVKAMGDNAATQKANQAVQQATDEIGADMGAPAPAPAEQPTATTPKGKGKAAATVEPDPDLQ